MSNQPTRPHKVELPSEPSPQEIYLALSEACRKDFHSFAMLCMAALNPNDTVSHNYHLQAVSYRLSRVVNGTCQRLMINLPPRQAKSFLTSVALPAFVLGRDPTRRVLVISHSLRLASDLSSSFRRVASAPWYRALFPKMRLARNTKYEVITTMGGGRRAVSLLGGLTGLGAHLLIFDDPLNAGDAYSDGTRQEVNQLVRLALARQDDKKNGGIIIAMQRLHEDDPCGNLLADTPSNWEVLRLAAIAEEDERVQIGENNYYQRRAGEVLHQAREPKEVLERIRSEVGLAVFAAHYQQQPVPAAGCIFKREWLQRVRELPLRTSTSSIIQAWDTAIKTGAENDYAACATVMLHNNHYYIIEIVRSRLEFYELGRRFHGSNHMG